MSAPVGQAKEGAEVVVRSSGFAWFARAGFVARGLIYGIIGILAVKLAVGDGGKTTNQKGALETVAHQPFGKFLLILVAAGLAGYAVWRFVRAALGHGPEGTDNAIERVAGLASGSVYAVICLIAIEILVGPGSGSTGNAKKTTGGVLGWPGGQWLVGAAGVVLVGVGLYQGYLGVARKFLDEEKTEQMSARVKRAITWIGVFGLLARMVVFGLVGVFLVKAAVDYSGQKAVGLDGALAKVVHQSYGSAVLGIVAAGLVSFAIFSICDARYRKI